MCMGATAYVCIFLVVRVESITHFFKDRERLSNRQTHTTDQFSSYKKSFPEDTKSLFSLV